MNPFSDRKTIDGLNRMLDDAIAGRFEESNYNESERSKLEVKWKRYLNSSKLSARKVEEERNSLKELVTDISHQTKTPLANILLYTQLLGEQPLDENVMEMVEEIHRQSEKLDFLIQSLIKTSRLETGTFQLTPEKGELFSLAGEVKKMAEAKAEAKGITIELCEESGQAVFDEKWTKEAVFNILDNAIKYSPEGSVVSLGIRVYEMFACIEIKDEGIGIEEEEIPKIFGRFYRGKDVRNEEGVGIGLYLARQIIENENGYIKVITKPGRGANFQIFLPRDTKKTKERS